MAEPPGGDVHLNTKHGRVTVKTPGGEPVDFSKHHVEYTADGATHTITDGTKGQTLGGPAPAGIPGTLVNVPPAKTGSTTHIIGPASDPKP